MSRGPRPQQQLIQGWREGEKAGFAWPCHPPSTVERVRQRGSKREKEEVEGARPSTVRNPLEGEIYRTGSEQREKRGGSRRSTPSLENRRGGRERKEQLMGNSRLPVDEVKDTEEGRRERKEEGEKRETRLPVGGPRQERERKGAPSQRSSPGRNRKRKRER
ncbi:hypothetical protein COCNU_scaffold016225G000050 [Cocos nucifera]|nr:hypothetical protein [Cocos nucifera]